MTEHSTDPVADTQSDEETASLLEAVRELPTSIMPERDLWDGIARRIEPPRERAVRTPRAFHRLGSRLQIARAASLAISLAAAGYAGWALRSNPVREAPALRGPESTAPFEGDYRDSLSVLTREFEEKKGMLEPKTIAIIEQNLRIIDLAIQTSRAALDADPASAALAETLSVAYETKVDLLRQVTQIASEI